MSFWITAAYGKRDRLTICLIAVVRRRSTPYCVGKGCVPNFLAEQSTTRNRRVLKEISGIAKSLKQAVLAELLALDVGFRLAAGGACTLADYTTRFPGYRETVSKLFDQLHASDAQPTCEVTSKEARSVVDEQHDHSKKPSESHSRKSDGSEELKKVPSQFGCYRILRELGRGGMGAVYLAHDGQLGRNIALKIPFFREDDEKEAVERFYREARAMAIVQHANLCPVFDVGRFEE